MAAAGAGLATEARGTAIGGMVGNEAGRVETAETADPLGEAGTASTEEAAGTVGSIGATVTAGAAETAGTDVAGVTAVVVEPEVTAEPVIVVMVAVVPGFDPMRATVE